MIRRWRTVLPAAAFLCFAGTLTGCGGAGKAPVKPAEPDPTQLQPAVLPAYATLDVMTNRKLARRLAIELNESIDFASIESALDDGGVTAGVEAAVASSRYAAVVSRTVGRALGSDPSRLFDLDVMAANDAALAASLTNAVRKGVADEAALGFERLMGNPASVVGDIFSGNSSVMSPAVASLWAVTGTPAWPGRPELLVTYADGRPPLGLIVSQGLVASASRLGGSASQPSSRAGAHFLRQFRCLSIASSHDFNSLDGADVSAAGLQALKSSSSACASCHYAIASAGNALLGLGRPGGISTYRSFSSGAGAAWPSNWVGEEIGSWPELSSVISSDAAIRSCLTQRVFEAFAQRPANYGRDVPRMAAIPAALGDSGLRISDWVKAIIASPATTSGPTIAASKVSALEGRVAKSRWMQADRMLAILAHAAPLASADINAIATSLAPGDLPGAGEGGRSNLAMSQVGDVWNSVQSAAQVIVQREFAAGVTPSTRSIFKGVTDPATLTSAELETEAARIWELFTGQEATESRVDALVDLYELAVQASASGTAAQKAQDGLVAVLVSILTSPYFLSY